MEASLQALNGIRAIANLWVVATHITYQVLFVADRQFVFEVAFPRLGWLRASFMAALFSMDAFITLSGFLAAWHLLPKFQNIRSYEESDRTIFSYYKSRFLRLVPALYIFLTVHTLAIPLVAKILPGLDPKAKAILHGMLQLGPESCSLPVQASDWLLLANFSGRNGCLYHFWNLSVQMQFFLLFPWAVLCISPTKPGFKSRFTEWCGLAAVLSLAWRFWIIWEQRIIPNTDGLPDFATYEVPPSSAAYTFMIHGTLYGRMFHLALGCWLATAVRRALEAQCQGTGQVNKDTNNKVITDVMDESGPGKFTPTMKDITDESSSNKDDSSYANATVDDSISKHPESNMVKPQSSPVKLQSVAPVKHPNLPLCSWSTLLACICVFLTTGLMFGNPPNKEVQLDPEDVPVASYMVYGVVLGIVCPCIVAYLIYYCTVQPDRIAAFAASLLCCKPLQIIARYSYGVFLVHFHVTGLALILFPPNTYLDFGQSRHAQHGSTAQQAYVGSSFEGLPTYLAYFVAVYSVSFVLGAGLEKLAEALTRLLFGGSRVSTVEQARLAAKKKEL